MKTRFNLLALLVLLTALVLSACGAPAPAATEELFVAPAATEAPAAAPAAELFVEQPAMADSVGQANAAQKASGPPADLSVVPASDASADPDAQNAAFATSHMIIKNGDIKLQVEDTDLAIDLATQVIGDMGGYIISSRVWYQPYADGENYKYATITIGVPVIQFERTLSRLRGLAVKVLDETASGEDVTNQYVDLQSQITNLEATRDRIKAFLDEAKTVDEALRINTELTNVEAQIEQIKGQMNYLQDRSAYSTITINLEPKLPELIATPTSTPTPTPTPVAWKPGETFNHAGKAVTYAYQGIIDFLIWVLVVFVPIFAPPVLIIWGLWKLFTRKPRKPTQ
jgi:hypothetical protein